MTEPIQTTRMRRLPTVFGVFTTFSDDIPDVKWFAKAFAQQALVIHNFCSETGHSLEMFGIPIPLYRDL